MPIFDLYLKFKKGCNYFNAALSAGRDNPYLRRQMAEFETEVIVPFDALCKRALPEEIIIMEDQYGIGVRRENETPQETRHRMEAMGIVIDKRFCQCGDCIERRGESLS